MTTELIFFYLQFMKRITLLFFALVASYHFSQGQDTNGNAPAEIVKYYFVELITNPERPDLPQTEVDSIQRAHMANIGKMVEEKTLMLAGPFEAGGGIFILNVENMDAAKALVARDPAVKAGRLLTEIRPWYTATGVFTAEEKKKEN